MLGDLSKAGNSGWSSLSAVLDPEHVELDDNIVVLPLAKVELRLVRIRGRAGGGDRGRLVGLGLG